MNGNILEKDIEEAIYDGQLLMKYGIKIVGRQVRGVEITNPSGNSFFEEFDGVVDLIGYHASSKTWIIIELKRNLGDCRAFTQLSRYMESASSIAHSFWCNRRGRKPRIAGLLICSDITDELCFLPCLADYTCLHQFNGWEMDLNDTKREPIYTLCFSAKTTLEVSI